MFETKMQYLVDYKVINNSFSIVYNGKRVKLMYIERLFEDSCKNCFFYDEDICEHINCDCISRKDNKNTILIDLF